MSITQRRSELTQVVQAGMILKPEFLMRRASASLSLRLRLESGFIIKEGRLLSCPRGFLPKS